MGPGEAPGRRLRDHRGAPGPGPEEAAGPGPGDRVWARRTPISIPPRDPADITKGALLALRVLLITA